MPMPQEHLKRLEEDLAQHQERLESLLFQIEGLREEAAVHETLLKLGGNRRILETLDELYADDDLLRRLAESPDAILAERKISLPRHAEVRASIGGPDGGGCEVDLRLGAREIRVLWTRTDGLTVVPAGIDAASAGRE